MTANPSIVGSPTDTYDGLPPSPSSDATIFYAINTFLAMLKVSDALLRVSRTISDRRRRAAENGSGERWWPALNRELNEKHIVPLMDELATFQPKDGYDYDAVMALLREASATLIHAMDETPLPTIKTDGQLIEEHLRPTIALLCNNKNAGKRDASDEELLLDIVQLNPRECFKNGSGHKLVSLLEDIVASEPRSVPHMLVTHDASMFGLPGVVVELSHEEADAWGVTEEDAISEEDAWDTQADMNSYTQVRLTNRKLGWYECDTTAKSVLFAASVVRQRTEERKIARKQDGVSRQTYFCELCNELTEAKSKNYTHSIESTPNQQLCKAHAALRRKPGSRHGSEFNWLVSTMLHEAKKDAGYKQRFMPRMSDGKVLAELTAHIVACSFCSGRGVQSSCLDPSAHYFPALMAFHANVRKVAHKLANSYHSSSVAFMIDEAVQRGECIRDTARYYGLRSDKAIGQHLGVALAHLLHQKVSGTEVASRLGISPSAVSQRRAALTGSFDFNPKRYWALRWCPFDDRSDPDVAKFSTRALGTNWHHSTDEYEHLLSSRKTNIDHRRLARPSSLPTKSSARRCV